MNGNDRTESMKRVQKLAFMKTETELFLDTHPNCRAALDFYHRILEELEAARLEYRAKYGPITAEDCSTERWDWVDGPWPWQMGAPEDMKRRDK